MFRLTINDKSINQDASRLGDRTLCVWANPNLNYYPATYNVANMNGAGDGNRYNNVAHNGQNTQWHYIYFGYSKTAKRAYFVLSFKSSSLTLDFPNTNHYWTEKLYFLFKDSRYSFWNGQIAYTNVILGKGAFQVGGDYARDDDALQFGVGASKFWTAGPQVDWTPE